MADNKIVLKIEVEKEGGTATLKNFENEVIKSGVAIKDLRKELGNFVVHSNKMSNSVKLTGKELKNLEKTVGGFKTSTGAAAAAAMELGRVVSDAPYGIRGMANNVSQLASQITFMANATDKATGKTVGWLGAFKNVGKSLMGTTGVLLAIQAVIAAIDYFANRTDEASSSVSDFRGDLDDLVKTLDDFGVSQDGVNQKILEYIEFRTLASKSDEELKKLTEEMADLDDDIMDRKKKNADFELLFKERSKGLTIEQYKALSEQEKAEVRRTAQITNLTQKIGDYDRSVESVVELEKKRVDTYNEAVGVLSKYNDEKDKLNAAEEGTVADLRKQIQEQKKLQKNLSDTSDKWREYQDVIDGLQKRIDEITGGDGKKRNRPRANILDFETPEDFRKRLKLMFESIKKDLKALKVEEILQQNARESTEIIDLNIKYNIGMSDEMKKRILEHNKAVVKEFMRITQLEEFQEYSELFQDVFSSFNDFWEGEFDRQLTMEQNKTSVLNNELNQRLLNEQLSADERRNIQQQIWQNDESLRRRQEQIEKKRFRQQKAFNIAMATIDTFRAATGVLADTKGGTFARIAGMVTVITTGLAQVATIARQQFQSSSARTPIRTASGGSGGAGGGLGDRSFNFTLAGQTEGNQLIDAIQSQFDNPIRAYVVSGDVTNQQQLDANISGSASF